MMGEFVMWFELASLFDYTVKYTAALKAYFIVFKDQPSNNLFIEAAEEVLCRQIYSELFKIYDRASTRSNVNCSINQLAKVCKESSAFSDEEKKELSEKIDKLNASCDALLPKELRNKKIAHYDLESICKKYDDIAIDDIEKLVKNTASFLEEVSSKLCFADAKIYNFEELVVDYQKSILELKQG